MANRNDSSPVLPTSSNKSDKRKQSLYFPDDMLKALTDEAARLDRSMSWVVQRCVKLALPQVRQIPGLDAIDGKDGDEG